jgi:hypothetical protein
MPPMRKRELNPVHVALTDKRNDLRQALEELLPKQSVAELLALAADRGAQATRAEIGNTAGKHRGAYHLAYELVKLAAMLERVPLYA